MVPEKHRLSPADILLKKNKPKKPIKTNQPCNNQKKPKKPTPE